MGIGIKPLQSTLLTWYIYTAAKVVITHELDVGESLIISELVEDFLDIVVKFVKDEAKDFP